MRFEDYRELEKEVRTTDSIKRREELEKKIYEVAYALFRDLEPLYEKYGKKFVDDEDYRNDRGTLTLDEVDGDDVWLHYYDHWSHGGECSFGIRVKMKLLDQGPREELEKALAQKRLEKLKKELESSKQQIKFLEKRIETIEPEIQKLERRD